MMMTNFVARSAHCLVLHWYFYSFVKCCISIRPVAAQCAPESMQN